MPVPLHELSAAVQDAVQRVLAQHGAVPIDKLWVGFVAPENLATRANADKLATMLGKEGGVTGQGSVAQFTAAEGALPTKPGHIIGLVYSPKVAK